MKSSLSIQQLLLLFTGVCCICCTEVIVQSNPSANGGFILTEEDKTVSLSCRVEGTADGEELQWYRNENLVSLKDENRLEQSHLCVDPVTRDDNGAVFTCQLKTNASVKVSVQLEVNYVPVLNGSEEVRVEEESDTVLSCNVHANPPLTIIWKKNNELLDLSSSSYQTSNNGITAKLSISNINRETHQGVYICEATSSIYGVMSKSFIIIVEDKVLKFPLGPTIAGIVVVLLTILLAIISRWQRIAKFFKRASHR